MKMYKHLYNSFYRLSGIFILILISIVHSFGQCTDFDAGDVREVQYHGLGLLHAVTPDGYLTSACPGTETGGLTLHLDIEDAEKDFIYGFCFDLPWFLNIEFTNLINLTTTITSPQDPNDPIKGRRTVCANIIVPSGSTEACSRITFKFNDVGNENADGGTSVAVNAAYNLRVASVENGTVGTFGPRIKLHPASNPSLSQQISTLNGTMGVFAFDQIYTPGNMIHITDNSTYLIDNFANIGGVNADNPFYVYCGADSEIEVTSIFVADTYAKLVGCNNLWNGINITDENAIVEIKENSLIRGAKNGINREGESRLQILVSDSDILNCIVGINLEGNGTDVAEIILENTNISLNGSVPSTVTGTTSTSSRGINVSDYAAFSVFNPRNTTNTIEGYRFGIRLRASNGIIENFDLKNCNYGIFNSSNLPSGILNLSMIHNNTFQSCRRGIWSHRGNLDAQFNEMYDVDEGIFSSRSRGIHTVLDNKPINANQRGIYHQSLMGSPNNRIQANEVIMTSTIADAENIAIESYASSTDIFDNVITLKGTQVGILSNRDVGASIDNNEIFIEGQGAGATGIRVEGSENNTLFNNTIIGNSSSLFSNSTGIHVNHAPSNTYDCNTIDFIETGVLALSTNQSSTFRGTNLQHVNVGFQLDLELGGQGAVIGDQFIDIDDQHGNEWNVDAGFRDAAHYTDDQQIIEMSRFAADKNISKFWPNLVFTEVPANWFIDNTFVSIFECADGAGSNSDNGFKSEDGLMLGLLDSGLSSNTITAWLIQSLEQVKYGVEGGEYNYEEMKFLEEFENTDLNTLAEVSHLLKHMESADYSEVYGQLSAYANTVLNSTEEVSVSNALDDYAALISSVEVDNSTLIANLAQVDALLESIVSENEVVNHQKETYKVYYNYLIDDVISEEEESYLEEVANLCVAEYGEAVVVARGLLSTFGPRVFDDNLACGYNNPETRTEGKSTTNLTVYPNPTTGLVNLGSVQHSVLVTSLDGVRLLSGSNTNVIDMNTLPNGIYLIQTKEKIESLSIANRIIKID